MAAIILNTELMYLCHEYKLIFYDPFSRSHARNKHFSKYSQYLKFLQSMEHFFGQILYLILIEHQIL